MSFFGGGRVGTQMNKFEQVSSDPPDFIRRGRVSPPDVTSRGWGVYIPRVARDPGMGWICSERRPSWLGVSREGWGLRG